MGYTTHRAERNDANEMILNLVGHPNLKIKITDEKRAKFAFLFPIVIRVKPAGSWTTSYLIECKDEAEYATKIKGQPVEKNILRSLSIIVKKQLFINENESKLKDYLVSRWNTELSLERRYVNEKGTIYSYNGETMQACRSERIICEATEEVKAHYEAHKALMRELLDQKNKLGEKMYRTQKEFIQKYKKEEKQ